ncbi:MAG TPA: tetratricopeptide repeat protein [Flavisolibacter sp.]|nr:tetratricopeptide repeat protein [Flavisolibacter sp.]
MAENLPIDELVLKYLDDELSTGEKKAFEEQLKLNPDIKKRLENLRLVKDSIKYYGINQKVAEVRRQWEKETPALEHKAAKVISIRKPLRYTLAIAASTIFVIIGIKIFWISNVSPEKIYQDTYVSYSIDNLRSQNVKTTAVEKAWKQKNYVVIIDQGKKNVLSTKDQLLLGLSYLELNQPAEAIPILESIRESRDTSLHYDADFYLSLAYIKNKELDKALPLLEKIQKDPNHPYHRQVSEKTISEVEKLK